MIWSKSEVLKNSNCNTEEVSLFLVTEDEIRKPLIVFEMKETVKTQ